MEINVSKLDNVLNDYDMIIKKVSQNNSDIYGNFTELSKNWKDQRITNMMTKYNSEKSSYSQLEKNIKNQYYVYKFLQTKYSKLGNKIKCNLNNKDLIKEKLNNIVDQLSTIIWQYDNLGDLSWCPISGLIYEQRDDLSVILENFKSIRKTINDKFNYVSSVENAIAESLKNNKIAYLPINNYEREA